MTNVFCHFLERFVFFYDVILNIMWDGKFTLKNEQWPWKLWGHRGTLTLLDGGREGFI